MKTYTWKTLRHCWKIEKDTNGKKLCAHWLDELTVLNLNKKKNNLKKNKIKCPYYLKQSTDWMQSQSKSQGHFSQK